MSIEDLKAAYREMAALTKPRCGGKTCKPLKPGGCCDRFACAVAKSYAKDTYGITLEYVDPCARIPFLRDGECIVEPYLRPVCAVHDCRINALGGDPEDPEWTERYFELRDRIAEMEEERFEREENLTWDLWQKPGWMQ